MPKQENKKAIIKDGDNLKTTITNLPGLKNVEVIVSRPTIVRENSSKAKK